MSHFIKKSPVAAKLLHVNRQSDEHLFAIFWTCLIKCSTMDKQSYNICELTYCFELTGEPINIQLYLTSLYCGLLLQKDGEPPCQRNQCKIFLDVSWCLPCNMSLKFHAFSYKNNCPGALSRMYLLCPLRLIYRHTHLWNFYAVVASICISIWRLTDCHFLSNNNDGTQLTITYRLSQAHMHTVPIAQSLQTMRLLK